MKNGAARHEVTEKTGDKGRSSARLGVTEEIVDKDRTGFDVSARPKVTEEILDKDRTGLDVSARPKVTEEILDKDRADLDVSARPKVTEEIVNKDRAGLDVSARPKVAEEIVDKYRAGLDVSARPKVTEETVHKDGSPIDRGWAWVILAAAAFQTFSVIGILKCGGILFVLFQEKFESSASSTSLISTVNEAICCVAALLILTVGMKLMEIRTSVLIGVTFNVTAFIISSLAPTINLLILSHGVLYGIGIALVETPSYALIGKYFDKKRGLANSIMAAGASAGALVFAPLITFLLEYYGYFGAMLIMAAILANGLVAGALFRPPKKKAKQESEYELNNKTTHITSVSNGVVDEIHHSDESSTTNASPELSPFLKRVGGSTRQRTWTITSTGSYVLQLNDGMANQNVPSHISIESIQELAKDDIRTKEAEISPKSFRELLTNFSSMFDLHLFKNPVFLVLQVGSSLLIACVVMSQIFISPHSRDNGLSEQDISTLVIVTTSLEAISRPFVGVLSDKLKFDSVYLVIISATILGINAQFISLYRSFGTIVIYCCVVGIFGGVYICLLTVILIRYFGLDKFQGVMGFSVLFMGIIVSIMYYVMGTLRDVTRSYEIPFRLLGGLYLLAAVAFGCTSRLHQRSLDKCKSTVEVNVVK